MELSKNEKGLTLIEVLISIVILSMILLTTMSFFPQMGLMNNQNKVKTQGINTAKELLLKWQNDSDRLNLFFKNPNASIIAEYKPITGKDYYNFETVEGDFFVNIQIKINPSKESKIYNAHQIFIKLYKNNKRDIAVSETYGYVKVRR
ncbi:prepilin-type N-terminal cleavage/methylation domain-containing protein [Paenibacillus sp. BSR1-1]|uniref:type IV pilus modification PilV family protein n=1 Tax=Paenibacillus sp. BSR1-1 TaxID=3020845 RepID=UPI0025B27310|nr:prepilin-type N-terminal cleavage/methylation domain-containing protein [Paenibacillus sp. BSR1-1]MDN3018503.1 prepilin-type N-terminal cleavage/methylation domain-containing protein [Paenibacillus sp. BSR1-1]